MTPCRFASWLLRTSPDESAPARRLRRTIAALRVAWQSHSASGVTRLLHPDAVLLVDSGGLVLAPTRAVEGAAAVSAVLIGMLATFPGMVLADADVNGMPGLVVRREGGAVGVVSLALRGGRIAQLWVVVNPEKLGHWN